MMQTPLSVVDLVLVVCCRCVPHNVLVVWFVLFAGGLVGCRGNKGEGFNRGDSMLGNFHRS